MTNRADVLLVILRRWPNGETFTASEVQAELGAPSNVNGVLGGLYAKRVLSRAPIPWRERGSTTTAYRWALADCDPAKLAAYLTGARYKP